MSNGFISFLTFPTDARLLDRTLVPPAPDPHTSSPPSISSEATTATGSARTLEALGSLEVSSFKCN